MKDSNDFNISLYSYNELLVMQNRLTNKYKSFVPFTLAEIKAEIEQRMLNGI